ncbi:MAG: efflux RND transporter periplasmic adaptor subunit [Pirellulales bacterium]
MPQSTAQNTIDHTGGMSVEIVTSPGRVINPQNSALDADLPCALLELLTVIADATSLEAAGVSLVNRLKVFLGADGVALGVVRRGRRRCRLAAIAGATEVNRGSELSVAVEHALGEATLADAEDAASSGSAASPALQAMLPGATIESCRLATARGTLSGALIVWGSAKSFHRKRAQTFLRFSSEPLAGTLRLVELAQAGIVRRALRRVFGWQWWICWTAVAVIGLVVMSQLPYRIRCDCAAEPLKRRFIAAPFAGIFEESLVRPGDLVVENQVLGRMDGHELRLELAAVTADQQQTRKSHDVNLAAGKVAAAQIDKLELERLEQQRTLLDHRIANIEIRSPVAGYVISGDLDRSEGAPLTIGKVLYEIAPLDQMIVEVAIDDDEVACVHEGQQVSIRFDAHSGETFVGQLTRIHPRSETRDARNVFIGEVTLEHTDVALRPGMKGAARISLASESLLTGLLSRLWHALTAMVGF